jgi:hypothetical protein
MVIIQDNKLPERVLSLIIRPGREGKVRYPWAMPGMPVPLCELETGNNELPCL